MTQSEILKLAIELLTGSKPARACEGVKKVNLMSEIGDIYWIPDEGRMRTAKKLVEKGYLEIEQMKDYLVGDWN